VPLAILLSVAIYESIRPRFARVVQTLSYLPHFLSWVIVYGVLQVIIGPGNESVLNAIIVGLGGQAVSPLTSTAAFPWVVLISDSWKEMGWTAILFIAALMGVDPSLFEAAVLDGCSAAKRTWHITLPSIRPVIVMVVLLRIGTILSAGFNQIFMLYNPTVYSVADIIDTWVYRQGLLNFEFSLATAVGIFKGIIALLLLLFSNWATKKFADSGVF
jgi:putative aldouronate transport system permease protein